MRTIAVLMLALAMLIGACGAGGELAGAGPAAVLADQPAGFPVALPVDRVLPGEVLSGDGNVRRATAHATSEVRQPGGEPFSTGGTALDQGRTLLLLSEGESVTAVSYAIFRLALADTAPDSLLIAAELLPADAADSPGYWVGLADYDAGYWRWLGPYTSWPLVLSGTELSVGLSDLGNLFVAIVAGEGANVLCDTVSADPNIFTVGPGQTYARIDAALADAVDGDTILVHPQTGNAAYTMEALFVTEQDLSFRAVLQPGDARIPIDGTGYDYNGVGSTPRAIFQFQPGADGCTVSGFELSGASNDSDNGAGVRINQANDITIRNCEIHDNDMGLMSNGNDTEDVSRNQLVEFCHVHHNGNWDHAGYNHNFYMGGMSVTVRACEINHALTGHNYKSRARFNRLEWCYLHDSANREFDLVDGAGETDYAGADSVIIGCLIVKATAMDGNKTVIHWGQDGGNDHHGRLWLVNNTIVTPYISPVLDCSAVNASASINNNLIWDTNNGQTGQQLINARNGAQLFNIDGSYNWLPYGMQIAAGSSIVTGHVYTAASGENPPFAGGLNPNVATGGWRLGATDPHVTACGAAGMGDLPVGVGQDPGDFVCEYRDFLWLAPRSADTIDDLGAFALVP
ncbi:hypothetical protein JW859_04105 [bacterium]|nr:hypothetical protein [bacterium]